MRKQYLLISVVNRCISVDVFDTHQEAAKAMHEYMQENGGIDAEVFDGGWGQEYEGEYFGFSMWGGYVNLDKYDMDWVIVEI